MADAAAIYCRISKDAAGQGLGVSRQEDLCRKLAAEKGWTVSRVYSDNDMSAYRGSPRPDYQQLLEDIHEGLIDAVVVVDQDRLTRHPSELEDFIILADQHGVQLANVSGEVDLSTSDGRFRARIMGAVARQESEKKSERLKRQKDQAASLGKPHGGRRRYGYTQGRGDDGHPTLEVVPEEADRVREAAARMLAGESLRSIAIDWNRQDIPTATGSSEWRVTTLRTMLTGPHVAGLRVHRGEIVGAGDWTPILDRGTWEQVRAVLGDPRRRQSGRPAARLLTGFLKCSQCGGGLHHSRRADTGARRYVCSASPSGCGRIAVAAEPAEAIIGEMVLDALAVPEFFAVLDEPLPANDADVTALEMAEAALDQLALDHYVEQRISAREYHAARSALDQRISELRELVATPTSAREDVGFPKNRDELAALWDQATLEERRQILAVVLEEVVVGPGMRGRRAVDPSRFVFSWRA